MKNEVIVIGGGPAGITAASFAAAGGKTVTLLERNEELGRKLLLTGKGRCNLTNATDVQNHVANMPGGGRFLFGALNRFSPSDLMAWMEEQGVPCKVERGQRVFPVADDAKVVRDALVDFLMENGVQVMTGSRVRDCQKTGQMFLVKCQGKRAFHGQKLILATGGCSYPATGSTGSGYRWAEAFGHTIEPPAAGLVPLITSERWLTPAAGLLLKNVSMKIEDSKGKIIFQDLGEVELTSYGLNGAMALSASLLLDAEEEYQLFLDLKPGLDQGQLDLRVQRDFARYSNKILASAFKDLLPNKLIEPFVSFITIPPDKPVNQITRNERLQIVDKMKKISLTVVGKRSLQEAIITAGGVKTREIDPKTMESRIVPGLFFAGELMDIHGFTGGFNLQAAFSTGYVAGNSC